MPTDLLAIAAVQWSAFCLAQALSCGLTDADLLALRKTGVLRAPHRDVFVLCGTPDTPEQRLWIAYLAVRRPCAFAGLTAGWLWRLPGCPPPRRPSLVVPGDRRPRTSAADIRRIAWWSGATIHHDRGLPRLGVRDTVLTVAPLLPASSLLSIVQHVAFHQLTTVDELRGALRRGLPGAVALGAAVDRFDVGHDSQPEVDVRRTLSRAAMPPDHCNVWLRAADGTVAGPYDGYYEVGVAYEYDGRDVHDSVDADRRDTDKSVTTAGIDVRLVRLDRRDRADRARLTRRMAAALAEVRLAPAVTVVHSGQRGCICGWAPAARPDLGRIAG